MAVKKIIDEWDPCSLKPDNTYGIETVDIVKSIMSSGTREDARIIGYRF